MQTEQYSPQPSGQMPTAVLSISPRRQRSTSSQAQAERENTVRRAIDFGGVSQAAAPSLSPPPRTSLKLGGTPASGPGSTSRTPSSKNSRCPSSTPATVRRNKVVDMDAADLGSTAASPHQDYSMLSDNSTQLPSDASPFHIPSSDEKLLAPCSSSPVLSALTHRHPQHPRPSSSSTTPLRYPQARPRREASKTLAALQALIMPAASPDAAPRRSRGAQGSLSSSEGSASAILSGMVAGSTTPSGQWNGDSRGVNSHGRNKGGRGGGSIALPANYHAVLAEGAVHYKRARAWQRRSILFESFALWLSSHHETARYVSALRKTNDRQRVRRLERCMAAWVAAAGQAGRPWDALMNVACKVGEAGMERRLRGVMQMWSCVGRRRRASQLAITRSVSRTRRATAGRVLRWWARHAHEAQEMRRREQDRLALRDGLRRGKISAHLHAWRHAVLLAGRGRRMSFASFSPQGEGTAWGAEEHAVRWGSVEARVVRGWARAARDAHKARHREAEGMHEKAAASLLQEVTNLALMLGNEADEMMESRIIEELVGRTSQPLSICGLPFSSRSRARACTGDVGPPQGGTEVLSLCEGVELGGVVIAVRELVAMLLLRKKAASLETRHMAASLETRHMRGAGGLGRGGLKSTEESQLRVGGEGDAWL